MRARVSGSTITAHGDNLGVPYVEFYGNEPLGFSTNWTVSGSSPTRVLVDPHGHEFSRELPTQTMPATGSSSVPDPSTGLDGEVPTIQDGAYALASVSATTTVSDTDPGAIGAANLWLQTDPDDNFNTLQLWVRNATDDGWKQGSLGSSYLTGTTPADAGYWDAATGRLIAGIVFQNNGVAFIQSWETPTDPTKQVRVSVHHSVGIRLTQAGTSVEWGAGTVDPSAGAGVVADPGSLYSRRNGSTGELWVKTGAADTAWNKVTTA